MLEGETDIFFGVKPSASQLQLAEDDEKTLVLTPIGKEAFVFFVNTKNPVDGLTSQQIRDFMGDLPLREPLKNEYVGGMFDLITRTANYQNRSSAIGYSFRYFASIMINDMTG